MRICERNTSTDLADLWWYLYTKLRIDENTFKYETHKWACLLRNV